MARGRNGIQYATTTTKRCPMFDDACAERVIALIAERYPVAYGACDCDATARLRERILAKAHEDITSADLDLSHAANCASRLPIPFNAAALVEERCGRYTRGAHKGKLRGWASIEVVTEGGWKKSGPGEGNGRVVYPGTVLSVNIGDDYSGKTFLAA